MRTPYEEGEVVALTITRVVSNFFKVKRVTIFGTRELTQRSHFTLLEGDHVVIDSIDSIEAHCWNCCVVHTTEYACFVLINDRRYQAILSPCMIRKVPD